MPMDDPREKEQTTIGNPRQANASLRLVCAAGGNTGIVFTSKAGVTKVLYIGASGALSLGTWDNFIAGTDVLV